MRDRQHALLLAVTGNAVLEVSHMVGPLTIDREAVAGLCRRYGVKRLTVFGSAATRDFDEHRSDVDFLVEFVDPGTGGLGTYFGFKEDLEALLGLPVDLVSLKALENPYFAAEVRRTEAELYAA